MEQGLGKDREGKKRQDDNWKALGTMNTKFVSFPARQKLSSCWYHRGEEHPLLSDRPHLPFARGCVCGPSSNAHMPTNLGHRKLISPAQVLTPASSPLLALGSSLPAGNAAVGFWARQELPCGQCMWHRHNNLCFVWVEGVEVS